MMSKSTITMLFFQFLCEASVVTQEVLCIAAGIHTVRAICFVFTHKTKVLCFGHTQIMMVTAGSHTNLLVQFVAN